MALAGWWSPTPCSSRPQWRHVLDLLDAGDPLALLRWVTAPAPPLQLTNTEGEPLVLVTAAYRIADPTAVAVALGGTSAPRASASMARAASWLAQPANQSSSTRGDRSATVTLGVDACRGPRTGKRSRTPHSRSIARTNSRRLPSEGSVRVG